MENKDLDYKLSLSVDKFTASYKNTLSTYEDRLDDDVYEAFYDLGAEIKHALDDFQKIIVENSQK